MKKFLFLSLALTCALAGYAQKPTVKDGYITKSQMKDLPNQKMERADLSVSSHQRRAVTVCGDHLQEHEDRQVAKRLDDERQRPH